MGVRSVCRTSSSAAGIYYFKGSAPISPDDMASFNATVSQGIDSVASSQASLHDTLLERVNSAAFRSEIIARSSEEILSDILVAGEAVRLRLEQTRGLTQDLTLMNSRISTLDDSTTSLLKGIVYLISLRWVLSNMRLSRDSASGSEVVNEVMSNERPFSFSF